MFLAESQSAGLTFQQQLTGETHMVIAQKPKPKLSPNQNYNVRTAKIVSVTDIVTRGIVILPYKVKVDS